MDIKSGEISGIKNINSSAQESVKIFRNKEVSITSPLKKGDRKIYTSSVKKTNNAETSATKIEINTQDSKVRELMNQIKDLETRYSSNQVYITALKKAQNFLNTYQNIEDVYKELMELYNNTKFNNKLLLKAIIPQDINFYNSAENISQLRDKISREINTTENAQSNLLKKLNRTNISLENMNAMKIEYNPEELKSIKIGNRPLYNNLNHQIIVSLIEK